MPFPMKIQPIDAFTAKESIRNDHVKPVVKSRIKRLFERQFPSVLRISSVEKPGLIGEQQQQYNHKDSGNDWEPSSACLAKMVQNFMEESNEKQSSSSKCGRNRCNCFNVNCSDSSDDEFDFCGGFGESIPACSSGEILKGLVPCSSIAERNLLADTAKILEKNKTGKRKDDCRKIVTDGLVALGYDASICKSRWEKSASYPAGEYEYVDVIVEGERLLIDIDFKSEFEIARSTGNYRAILQILPSIFVGKPDRLKQIVSIVSEAVKQSLKKKGMHFPPWRKAEYMRAKWLSPHTRTTTTTEIEIKIESENENENEPEIITMKNITGEFEISIDEEKPEPSSAGCESGKSASSPVYVSSVGDEIPVNVSEWKPPAIKQKSCQKGAQIVTGLASVLMEKP